MSQQQPPGWGDQGQGQGWSGEGGPPPPPPNAGYSPYPGNNPPGYERKGFFGALFDFSFTHFITPMIVKAVYVIATVLIGLFWLVWLVVGFRESTGLGVAVLVIGPIIGMFYLALIRMTFEFYVCVVRMSEDIHKRLPQS